MLRSPAGRGAVVTVCVLSGAALLSGCNGAREIDAAHQILEAPAETISVHQLAGMLGLRVLKRTGVQAALGNRWNSVTIFTDPDGGAYVNGARLEHSGPIVPVNGTIFLPASLAPSIRAALRPAPPEPAPPKPPPPQEPPSAIVVLDPGHGGRLTGATSPTGMLEKDCVLAVAREVRGRLAGRNLRIILTREEDRLVGLERRAEIANQAGADLFVSIHADWAPSRSAHGHTVYVARGASPASLAAAGCIDRRLSQKAIHSRGVRQANFRVLVQTTCPAVLVEIGYLSNHAEASRLATTAHRCAVADAIAQGVIDAIPKLRPATAP